MDGHILGREIPIFDCVSPRKVDVFRHCVLFNWLIVEPIDVFANTYVGVSELVYMSLESDGSVRQRV